MEFLIALFATGDHGHLRVLAFGGDVANPDTNGKFWADIQGWNVAMNQPDPQVFVEQYTSWQVSQKANKWSSRNRSR